MEDAMAQAATAGTMTGKPLIESDRVEGTTVYDPNGNKIGSVWTARCNALAFRVRDFPVIDAAMVASRIASTGRWTTAFREPPVLQSTPNALMQLSADKRSFAGKPLIALIDG
jgi:hypothetical protein